MQLALAFIERLHMLRRRGHGVVEMSQDLPEEAQSVSEYRALPAQAQLGRP